MRGQSPLDAMERLVWVRRLRRARLGAAGLSTLALLMVGVMASPGLRSVLVLVLVLSIFAVSYGVLLGFVNQPSLGQSLFFGLGAYGVIRPFSGGTAGFWEGIVAALLLGLVGGLLVGAIAVRLSEAYHVIVTALFASVAHLAANNLVTVTGGTGGLSARVPPVSLGPIQLSVYDSLQQYLLALAFAVISFGIFYTLVRSPLGTVWRAIRENEPRALSTGYNTYAYKLVAFAICAVFTALSGSLYGVALRYASSEFFGLQWSVVPFLWVLLGGLGTLLGPLIGVALFTTFQFYVSQIWTHYLILFGIVMLVVLRWAPQGIAGYLGGLHERSGMGSGAYGSSKAPR
jgi:branched-chain amino acid transport system permease protein